MQDDVRAELIGGDAGGEPALGDLDFVLRLVFENFLEHFDDVLFVIDDEDARLSGHQTVQRHAVLLHEADELVQRNAAVLRAGNSVAVQRAGVEPLADGSRGDVADLGDFAGREDIFHLGCGAHGIFSRQCYPTIQNVGLWLLTGLISTNRLLALVRPRSFCRCVAKY